MKKSLILPVLVALFAAAPAYAANITLTPTTITVAPGDTVSVVLVADPAGTPLSVVEAKLNYDASLLTPTAFTFAPTWIPVTQSGYDQMGGGTLTKTAGYPSGLASSTTFGTITFTAQAAGVATVSVQGTSMTYDTNAHNVLSGTQGSSAITIQNGGVTATPTDTTTGTTGTGSTGGQAGSGDGSTASAVTTSGTIAATDDTSDASSSDALAAAAVAQTAAAADAGVGFFSSFWGWLILLLILILIAGGSWYYARKKGQ